MSFRVLGYSGPPRRTIKSQYPKVDNRLGKELAKKLIRSPKPQENKRK